MIDIYFDDVNFSGINFEKEGFKLIFKNEKDESLSLILGEDNFRDFYYIVKNRCETQGLIPVYNKAEVFNT